ncbi:MAG: hypothetical protein PSU93_09495 [Methylobacter sp.]|uniref:Uncharacterized protein n=1 Tax=Candidatus Methylobacter titanis TaxID=3053457 RepID=A0AA43TQ14_9GAMM|nr:hypothetical protein [Candidatus Methylobacter titanis]
MSSQPNHDAPASMDEIAAAIGKSKRTAERMTDKYNWLYSEVAGKGRYKKRLYALKDLPWQIREAIQTSRGQEQAFSVSSESVAARASCSSPADTDFMAIDMAMTLKLTSNLVQKFSFVFPLPDGTNLNALCRVWHQAIEDLDPDDVNAAGLLLIKRLTRFPYPADLREAVRSLHAPQGCDENHGTPYSLVQELMATQITLYKALTPTQGEQSLALKNEDVISQAHAKAFTVSASVSTDYLQKLRDLIDRAMETGAAFDEVKTAIQHLDSSAQVAVQE